jgi:hypothetical protein
MRRRRRNPGVVSWAKRNPVKAGVVAFVAFGVYVALFGEWKMSVGEFRPG